MQAAAMEAMGARRSGIEPWVPALGRDRPGGETTALESRGNVLVVDDEQPIVAILSEVLRNAGFTVTGVDRAAKALSLPASQFDLLVTDFKMPDLDGISLFEHLRADNGGLVGILVTGFGNLGLVQEAMRRGLSGLLLKPFRLDRVTATVERALSQRWLAAENERLAAILEMYTARQNLHQPRSREDLGNALATLAAAHLPGAEAFVLLADAGGVLRPPRPHPGQAWVTEWAGRPAADTQLSLHLHAFEEWRVAHPLDCDGASQGVMLISRHGERPTALEIERIGLLAQQASLVLSHLQLFESRLREEKLALVGRMAGVICQRVREPLQVIDDAVSELTVDTDDYVQMIRDETSHLARLCDELSDLVAGSDGLTREDVLLDELLADLAHRLAPDLRRQHIVVDTELQGSITACVDPGKLTRALFNLIKNAAEAMPDGGQLTLGLREHDGQAVLRVSDTGVGMKPDVMARVFEPFYTHGKVHGTGLGGAVVRSAVQAHGGRVEVASRIGEGTTFSLVLPL